MFLSDLHLALAAAHCHGVEPADFLAGIDCGHIHRPALVESDGMICANDGDRVESLTALAEEADGSLRLQSHRGDILADTAPRSASASGRRCRSGRIPH